ncbi:lactocepin [Oceanobacillus chungangensis]|uniref:Lactocepin n=1 Tax=Oceanobacillus chungangensis TaxID=1229152 RepID=A0A3D8Q1B2_9BACI|nr:lactocepin [Oceanobacillus chungangensis]
MGKLLAVVLVLLLTFSNFSVISANPVKVDPVELKKEVTKKEKIKKEELDEIYKESDKVRVIVEVQGEPAITYATGQGKKFSELSEAKREELQAGALKAQEKVKNELSKQKLNVEYKESFTTVFNGFSGIVEYGKIEAVEKLPGVTNVTISNEYERPKVEPDMRYSKELVEAQKTWDEYGYDGEGMIVGVIDSGVDPSHKDFVLTDEKEAVLTKDSVLDFRYKENLPGKYYTAKVPYGYNYMDENEEIRDLGPGASMHGMHVAGTVGANGDEENGGIKGVAPEAQILALKVFGNDPNMGSTWGDIYIKAIDDSIILGADVINMSLGSTAEFVDETDPEQQAIKNAVENGVLMSISAGNSAHLGNGFYNPYASNPDIGVVGSPGLSYDSLQVASVENTHMDMDALEFAFGGETGLAPFMSASSVHPNDDGGTFEIEFVGTGTAKDFAGKDLTGKFAIVVRGNSFVDTAYNAQDANAEGVIVYNHSDGWVSMASEPDIFIPQLFMAKTDGELLKQQLDAGETVTISFNGDGVTTANPLADSMSDFTSWGVTPNLDFKPEITAPGGNILSTFQDDQYGTMSGTSMAAPHVAGGSALVLERVDEEFDLEGKARVEMAKNILMNTAEPVIDKGTINEMLGNEIPYSPRRQGSGIMQLHKAISTPVVVTEKKTGEAKVALKEVGDKFTFTLEAKNYSDEELSYDVASNVQTDLSLFGTLGYAADELESAELQADVKINNGKSTVKIPAGKTASIKVEVDLSKAKVLTVDDNGNFTNLDPNEVFPNGYFVEGFVTLTDAAADELPNLSVPYVGFAGDWNTPPILDELAYDGNDSFYEEAAMLYDGNDGYYYLGYDPLTGENLTKNIAISPNGDGANDEIIPLLSFLRNAKKVEYSVLDKDKKSLRKIKSESNIIKNYFDAGAALPFRLNPNIFWDGTVKNKVVADGQYYLEIAATIDYEGKEAQKLQVPVIVDTIAPKLNANLKDNKVTFSTSDERSGVSYIEVVVNGKTHEILPATAKEYTFTKKIGPKDGVTLVAVDNAGNSKEAEVQEQLNPNIPVIDVWSPETFGIYDTSEIEVFGTVAADHKIVEFTVEGEPVELEEIEKGFYLFDTFIEFEDGDHPLNIYAKDEKGNETSLSNSRLFFVDTTAPGLKVKSPGFVDHKTKSAKIVAQLTDNFDELTYTIDGNEEFAQQMSGEKMKAISKEVTTEVSLEPGENVFNLEVVDIAGNTTTKEVTIYRATSAEDQAASRIFGTSRYDTAVEVSKDGWDSADTVILAQGKEFADALAGIPLAEKYDAPLLLTQPTKYTEVTKAEIERLGATTVYLLGGEVAISADVEAELTKQGLEVIRLAGHSRVDTAIEIANEVVEEGSSEQAVLVNGYNFPDALSVASYAAQAGIPILLTQTNKLPEATDQLLEDLNVNETLVIGGPVAVSEKVAKLVPNPERISGHSREDTAVAVAEYFDVDAAKYYVTTGADFPDALTVAARAAKDNTGVLLVRNSVSKGVSTFITANDIDWIKVIGGPLAVSDKILKELNKLLD